jgi:hypothetical protein
MRGPSALLSAATLVPSSADLNQEAAQSVTEGIGWKHQTTLPPRGHPLGWWIAESARALCKETWLPLPRSAFLTGRVRYRFLCGSVQIVREADRGDLAEARGNRSQPY